MTKVTIRKHRLYLALVKHGLSPYINNLDNLLDDIVSAMLPAKGHLAPDLKGNKLRAAQDKANSRLKRKNLF